jgi:hypothetical protein
VRTLATVWLSLFSAAARAAEPAILDAERVEVVEGVAYGTGGVRLAFGDDVVRGATFSVDLDTGRAVVVDGAWIRPGLGELALARAELDLSSTVGALWDGAFAGDDGDLRISGSRLELQSDGSLTGERVSITLCDCATPLPWRITARHLELVPGEVVRFREAWVRVLGVPLVPLPAGSLPLSRRSGFLMPVLGGGDDGLRVAAPLYLVLGPSADVTLTPEVRAERSGRLLAEGRYALEGGTGLVEGAAGWDAVTGTLRGGASVDHGYAHGPLTSALEGRLLGDEAYALDYGDSFLSRQVPWGEARALLGFRQVELDGDYVQSEAPPPPIAGVGIYRPLTDLPAGWVGTAEARAVAIREDFGVSGAGAVRGALGRSTTIGPTVWTPSLEGGARSAGSAAGNAAWGTLGLDGRVLAWHRGARAFERAEGTLRVATTAAVEDEIGTAALDPILGALPAAPWQIEPGVLYRWSAAGAVADVQVRAPITAAGVSGWVHSRVAVDRVSGWLQLQLPSLAPDAPADWLGVGSAGIAWDNGRTRVESGWVYADSDALALPTDGAEAFTLHQARWAIGSALPGPLAALRVNGAIARDLGAGPGALDAWYAEPATFAERWFSPTVGVAYLHPTGCIGIATQARFDPDQTLPDVTVKFTIAGM